MGECVACHQLLEVEIEFSDDEDVEMGESNAGPSGRQKYPDDVHLVRLMICTTLLACANKLNRTVAVIFTGNAC
jgi:hypothetical protein